MVLSGRTGSAMTDALVGKEITLHDASAPAAREQLKRLRSQVLDRSFPPEEALDNDALDQAMEQPLLIACVQGEVVGGALGKLYPDSETLYLRYLATRPGLRGCGVGTRLLEGFRERWVGEHTFAVFGAEDPRHHTAHHHYGDPHARLRFYARFGVEAVGIPYFQPRFQPAGERKQHLLLCVLGAPNDMRTPGALAAARVARFLREFFVDAEGPGALEDGDFQWLLRSCRGPSLPLNPLVDLGKVPNTEPPGSGGVG
jgi:GNAT superfamily N-acetyltransferase